MIIMAEHAGFCFGVKRAVDAISESLSENHEVWTIGLPIHNPQEVSRLESLGLRVAENDSEIPDGATVLIRAHGEPLEVINRLKSRGISVKDTTCPFVRKAQEKAASLSREGYYIVLLGDKNHPEIKGIIGHVDDVINAEVIADEKEAENVQFHAKTALISQTTQREENIIARGYTRKQLFLSKYLVSVLAVFLVDLATSLILFIFLIKNGLGFESSMIYSIFGYLFSLFAQVALFASLAFIIEKVSGAIIVNIFIPMFLPLLLVFVDAKYDLSFSNYWVPEIFAVTSEKGADLSSVLHSGLLALAYVVVFIFLGIFVTRNREVK